MISNGLGNQMFQYAFAMGLKEKGFSVVCDTGLLSRGNIHHGEVLDNYFNNVKTVSTVFYPFIARILYYLIYIYKLKLVRTLMNCLSIDFVMDHPEYVPSPYHHQLLLGCWQSSKFFASDFTYDFKTDILTDECVSFEKGLGIHSVSLHVRRGDYLNGGNINVYNNICTPDYYKKAIDYILEKDPYAIFYVFSDDLEWVKKNLEITNCIYVDINKGKDSWQDMYLMSKCQNNIIANSTFSWWAAWLNTNKEKIVICPSRFSNIGLSKDLFPVEWIKINP